MYLYYSSRLQYALSNIFSGPNQVMKEKVLNRIQKMAHANDGEVNLITFSNYISEFDISQVNSLLSYIEALKEDFIVSRDDWYDSFLGRPRCSDLAYQFKEIEAATGVPIDYVQVRQGSKYYICPSLSHSYKTRVVITIRFDISDKVSVKKLRQILKTNIWISTTDTGKMQITFFKLPR